jgi:hypothetical protein
MRDEVITDLDRQIQEALDIDPSPEFKARVRMRLAEQPRRYRVATNWLLAGVPALATVVVLALFVSDRNEVREVRLRGADVVIPAAAGSAAVMEPLAPLPIEKPTAERVRHMPRQTPTQMVLVPPSEREAFRRFLQVVTENPFAYSAPPDREDAPLSVPDITIAPIVIEPIGAAEE